MRQASIALAAVLLLVAAVVCWTARRLYARQPEQTGESRTYTVSFPAGWEPLSMANDSGNSAYVGFSGRDDVAGAFAMTLRDEGPGADERSVAANILPRSWLSRRRQDVLATRILGSLRFK